MRFLTDTGLSERRFVREIGGLKPILRFENWIPVPSAALRTGFTGMTKTKTLPFAYGGSGRAAMRSAVNGYDLFFLF
jgi:hypothetical protein